MSILSIFIMIIAFIWLLTETEYLTVRLPVGKEKPIEITPQINQSEIPYYWKSPEDKEANLIICHNRWNCPYHSKCQKTERWTGWTIPAKTIQVFDSTINLSEQCNVMRALFLKEMYREYNRKPKSYQPPLPKVEPAYQVRIGSHNEYVKWNQDTHEYEYSNRPKKGFIHRVVEDYTTKYIDSLCGTEWLKTHKDDEYPEPLIVLLVDEKSISINGNYKKGMIKEFVKANK